MLLLQREPHYVVAIALLLLAGCACLALVMRQRHARCAVSDHLKRTAEPHRCQRRHRQPVYVDQAAAEFPGA